MKEPKTFLLIDVGSTSTKVHFIEDTKLITQYAPTTVEKPYEDVMIGVRNAISGIEEKINKKLLGNVDLFLATSSAGGGLQMLVAGLVRRITAESAERAALSSGAIIMDVLAIDDGKSTFEKIDSIKHLRPDIILFSGGEDGGAISAVARTAEIISASNPKGKYIDRIPLVYAGNINARKYIQNILKKVTDVSLTENVRPKTEEENPIPARDEIHRLFMDHVMSRAPGYKKLTKIVDAPIIPTPGAAFRMVKKIAQSTSGGLKKNVAVVDLGGATTDIFTVIDGVANRTVSANLGMSYSIGNTFYQTGAKNIMRWIPEELEIDELKDRIGNKMLHPTALPETKIDSFIEEAIAREAIRLAFKHHKDFTEAKRAKVLIDIFGSSIKIKSPLPYRMAKLGKSEYEPFKINFIFGSGGALSYANRNNALFILIDSFEPVGITEIGVDSCFLLPHLGVLDTLYPEIAWELFKKLCYVQLGFCIAPLGKVIKDEKVITIGEAIVKGSEIVKLNLDGNYKIIPEPKFDIGAGFGKPVMHEFHGNVIIDTRGRPLFSKINPP
ncbi:glutamate mutase L [candidate division WOR-3 bacterium]|nr:glutamate mutase L [candidate division WOR-3 bacterium]